MRNCDSKMNFNSSVNCNGRQTQNATPISLTSHKEIILLSNEFQFIQSAKGGEEQCFLHTVLKGLL